MDKKIQVDVEYYDLLKLINKVPSGRLVSKVKTFEIVGKILCGLGFG